MDTIIGMKTFVNVVAAGSFTAAAQRSNMSTALVSKYIGQLEERLGARLLNRTTRSLALTEIGGLLMILMNLKLPFTTSAPFQAEI